MGKERACPFLFAEIHHIDVERVERLPNIPSERTALLSFSQTAIPLMLLKMQMESYTYSLY